MPTKPEEMMEALKDVYDPDLGINIVDMGLVYEVRLEGTTAFVDMTLTSPACPYGPMLISETQQAIKNLDGVEEVNVELVWDPPWTQDRLSDDIKLDLGLDY